MLSNSDQLHFMFFPQLAHGHLIPAVDMARTFARRGVKATIVTTLLNATLFANTIQREKTLGFEINMRLIKFPAAEVGLPEGCENVTKLTSKDMIFKFIKAIRLLQQPIEALLQELRPDCLVADGLFPWATDAAAKFQIPRLVFHGTNCFSVCVFDSLKRFKPFKEMVSDYQPFDVPGLPHSIKMTRSQIPDYLKDAEQTERGKIVDEAVESELKSYGVIVNNFRELEPAYAEHYTKTMGRKAWFVGPVSLCNNNEQSKAERGNRSSIDQHECLRWLNSKQPNSVLYICFGSVFSASTAQLKELAKGIEASGYDFIWVLNKVNEEEQNEVLLPEGFEERNKEKGLIIRGWAPQILILEHESVGGFMTHCGWNSTIESLSCGVPMVTWPVFAEQFCNEKLITDVLKIGVGVGAKEWGRFMEEKKFVVTKEDIESSVNRVMVGEEAEEMRGRAMELKAMARKAVEGGGSSHSDLNALLEELRLNRRH